MRTRLAMAALALSLPTAPAAAQTAGLPDVPVPPTPRVDAVTVLHGDTVPDPYRWLENLDDPDVVAWTKAQDAATRAFLESADSRAAIRRRMEATRVTRSVEAPTIVGDLRVWSDTVRDEGEEPVDRLWAQEGDAEPRLLLDTREFGPGARLATFAATGQASHRVDPDGRRVAYGITHGNSRWSTWRVRRIDSGTDLPDSIPGINTSVYTTVWWTPDGEGFYYAAFEPPAEGEELSSDRLAGQRVLHHRIGSPASEDAVVYARPDRPEWSWWVEIAPDGRHLFLKEISGSAPRIFHLDRSEPDAAVVALFEETEANWSYVGGRGDVAWFWTTHRAPNGRMIEIDLADPDPDAAPDLFPEREDAVLDDVRHLGGRFVVTWLGDALPRYRVYDETGALEREIEPPYIGWLPAGIVGRPDEPIAAYSIQGAADPGSVWVVDLRTGASTPFRPPENGFDPSGYVTRQVFYESADGTRVPMILMHREGLELDGTNPVWLYAYGYNWAALPWYQPQHRVWIEAGGVWALANVRGGGEYGRAWIHAGAGPNKQNGIDDFVAAGEWLIEEGYTSTDRLVANGGSSSGPLAAAAVIQRPELFGAAIVDYPFADLLRYVEFTTGVKAGFGDPTDPVEYRALKAWSPVHTVRPGVCYPPTLIAHGDEDRLAVPLHSWKLVAALQNAQGCPNPVLLQVAWGQGHTVGGIEERANQVAFLFEALEIEPPASW